MKGSSFHRKAGEKPAPKRSRRGRIEKWQSIQQWGLWPVQELYEQIRSILVFGQTPGERAKETGAAVQRTLSRKAVEFERYGMQGRFASQEQGEARETSKSLPSEIRQLILTLHTELSTISWREIAEVCYIRYGRKPEPIARKKPGKLVVLAEQLILPEFGATG